MRHDVFHLHLISDATGETLNAISRAACARFVGLSPVEHVYALIRSPRHLKPVLDAIAAQPGLVMFTLIDDDLRAELETRCRVLDLPCIAVLDSPIQAISAYLSAPLAGRAGRQHDMDAAYFRKLAALNYAIAHDDGQMLETLDQADVILVGPSRTSKTPTCIYLAQRGIKAANVPLVPDLPVPRALEEAARPLIVGLSLSPGRLVQLRRTRFPEAEEMRTGSYVEPNKVAEETRAAARLFARKGWPVIDVTHSSVEETAAAVLNLEREAREGRTREGPL